MIHNITLSLLGELPYYSLWLYSAVDFILVVLAIVLLVSPFILVIKLLGGN